MRATSSIHQSRWAAKMMGDKLSSHALRKRLKKRAAERRLQREESGIVSGSGTRPGRIGQIRRKLRQAIWNCGLRRGFFRPDFRRFGFGHPGFFHPGFGRSGFVHAGFGGGFGHGMGGGFHGGGHR